MRPARNQTLLALPCTLIIALLLTSPGCHREVPATPEARKLTHEETLAWVKEHRAWHRARKTKPMWARPVKKKEIGKEFQTADHATERAKEGYWLCAGVLGEPWFQSGQRIKAKFDPKGEETKQFSFDSEPHRYQIYKPKAELRNWVSQVQGTGIAGFYIRPNYDVEHPLYSPAGGYVVQDDVADPYQDNPKDVWLVQEGIFRATYELID